MRVSGSSSIASPTMNDGRHYVRLGLFVTASACVLVVALFALGWRAWFQPAFVFETYFDQSIAGLEIGAPASFRGVPLGQVTEILTSAATYERNVPIDRRRNYIVARVKASMSAAEAVQMKKELATLIGTGLRAQTRLAGVTGQQYLELDFMDAKKYPPLPFAWKSKYTYLPSAPSVSGEIIAQAQAFLASLDEADFKTLGRNLSVLAHNLDGKLGELPVARLSAQAENVLHTAEAVLVRFDDTLGNPSLAATLDNAAEISSRLRHLADSGELDRTIKGIDQAAQRIDVLLGDNQYDVRVIVQDLRVTADNLRVLSDTIKRDPSAAIFSKPPDKIVLPRGAP